MEKDIIWKLLFGMDFDNIGEAILADLIDATPIIGDITSWFRYKKAIQLGQPEFIITMRLIDFIGDLIPVLGEILDLITPTNTVYYLLTHSRRD